MRYIPIDPNFQKRETIMDWVEDVWWLSGSSREVQ